MPPIGDRIDTFRSRARGKARAVRDSSGVLKESARKAIVDPDWLEKFSARVTRTEQVTALFFVGPIVVISLTIIVALNELMQETFLANSTVEIVRMQWFVTFFTGGLFIMSAWGWFQFVRTGGFGFFDLGSRDAARRAQEERNR